MSNKKPVRTYDLAVVHEHPTWQQPLFDVLDKRGVDYTTIDLKRGIFADTDEINARVYFNQASPSAYLRGNTRAVPYGLTFLESLEADQAKVINGASAFRFELNKAVQARVLSRLGIDHPATLAFNHVEALRERAHEIGFPAILKPNQGGSGARMHKVSSLEEVESILADEQIWAPDHVMLLQEYLPHDSLNHGIVRMEFVDRKLLYAMRVRSDGAFNLCPSEMCNPSDGSEQICAIDQPPPSVGPIFDPYMDVPAEAVAIGERICHVGHLDVAGIEYLETHDGRRVFYDINANSNLRGPVGRAHGFDPFERVVDYLQQCIRNRRQKVRAA